MFSITRLLSRLPIFILVIGCVLLPPVSPAAAPLQAGQAGQPAGQDQVQKQQLIELLQKAFNAKDPREQERIYQQILTLDPNNALATQGLLDARRRIQQEESGRKEELDRKQRRDSAIEAARKAYLAGDLKIAQTQIDKALQIDPEDQEAQNLSARIRSDLEAQQFQHTLILIVLVLVVVASIVFLIVWLKKRGGVLEVIQGPEMGRIFPLKNETVRLGALGSEVDWALSDPNRRISRHHCDVLKSGRHFFLTDYSTNGTLVNGQQIPKGQPWLLKAGDEISLAGEVLLRFRNKWV